MTKIFKTIDALGYPASAQRCNCLRPDGSRTCYRRDRLGMVNPESGLYRYGIKVPIEIVRGMIQTWYELCFGDFPVEFLPQWEVRYLYDDNGNAYRFCETPLHGIGIDNGSNLHSVISNMIACQKSFTVSAIERCEDGDILTVNEDLYNIQFFTINLEAIDDRCKHNVPLADYDQSGEVVYPAECQYGKTHETGWEGGALFVRDELASGHGIGWSEVYCSGAQCDVPAEDRVSYGQSGRTQRHSVTVYGIAQDDVIIFTTGAYSRPVYDSVDYSDRVLMYHGGRQFRIISVLDNHRVKVDGLYEDTLVKTGDTFNITRLKSHPSWKFIPENEVIECSGMLSSPVDTNTAGVDETWTLNDGHGLFVGAVGRIGREYIQVKEVLEDNKVVVARGYIDPDQRIGYSKKIKPCHDPITSVNSICSKHWKGEWIIVRMKKCWWDYQHPISGRLCVKKRTSTEGFYTRDTNPDTPCANTLCPQYYSNAVGYSSTLYHEIVHRTAMRRSWRKILVDDGSLTGRVYSFYLTEVDGPSFMSVLGKFGLIEVSESGDNFGWHASDGEPVGYHFHHNGGLFRYDSAARYKDGQNIIPLVGDYIGGGDRSFYFNSSGQKIFGVGLFGYYMNTQPYRQRQTIYEIIPGSIYSPAYYAYNQDYGYSTWCLKGINGFSGALNRYKSNGGFR